MKFSVRHKKKTDAPERKRGGRGRGGGRGAGRDELVTKLRIKNTKKDEPDGGEGGRWVSGEEG